ncbi:MAG: hypothetical protein JW839_01920 [Candidatus Lokiarchaeota archaeon]|nr:hypothetical protein [Candidatus Lokiarchaeota archaeon]
MAPPGGMGEANGQAAAGGDWSAPAGMPLPSSKLGTEVYKIAQQMMDKHYCINIADLATACTRFIKDATRRSILDEIHRLERDRFLFDGKALTGTTVLENATRKELLGIITASPGIGFPRLRDATGKGNYLLAWHLSVLEKFTFVRSATIDGSLAYFPRAAPPGHDVLHAFLNRPGLKEMLLLFLRLGRLKAKAVESALDLPHATANRRLRKLVDRGFVEELVDVEGGATSYELSPAWAEPMRKFKAI